MLEESKEFEPTFEWVSKIGYTITHFLLAITLIVTHSKTFFDFILYLTFPLIGGIVLFETMTIELKRILVLHFTTTLINFIVSIKLKKKDGGKKNV